jgi:hypothetical protein
LKAWETGGDSKVHVPGMWTEVHGEAKHDPVSVEKPFAIDDENTLTEAF